MASYNTFELCDCNTRNTILVTSSINKCIKEFNIGKKINVWNNNVLVETIYFKDKSKCKQYRDLEKEYIKRKQEIAHSKKERRRQRAKERLKKAV